MKKSMFVALLSLGLLSACGFIFNSPSTGSGGGSGGGGPSAGVQGGGNPLDCRESTLKYPVLVLKNDGTTECAEGPEDEGLRKDYPGCIEATAVSYRDQGVRPGTWCVINKNEPVVPTQDPIIPSRTAKA